MQGIINRVAERMNSITFNDIAEIMKATEGKADFQMLAKTGYGRKVIHVSQYESFPAEIETKGDYIRDISVGFFHRGIKDQSWKFFCNKWA